MANNKKTETRTVYSVSSNSNNPSSRTQSSQQVKVAAGTPSNSVSNRNSNKPADHWSNAQYGSSFSKGDISKLQDKGFNSNQIMKIAQAAYASGNVSKTNKTNQALYDLSSPYLNRATPSMTVKGQTMYGSPYGSAGIGDPKKVFGWNGFGDSMSINKSGNGGYSQSGVWTLPSKYNNLGSTQTATTPSGGTPSGAGTGATGTDAPPTVANSPVEPVTPAAQEQVDPIGMLSGGGAGINSATGLKRAKSSWKTQGKSTKGTNNLNRGLTITGYNV